MAKRPGGPRHDSGKHVLGATCREKKRGETEKAAAVGKSIGLPVLSAAEARPLTIESMRPVGSYAYNIGFSDGHGSGIFPFVLLHEGP